jgi:hypothetical protein
MGDDEVYGTYQGGSQEEYEQIKEEQLAVARAEAHTFIDNLQNSFVIISAGTVPHGEKTRVDVDAFTGLAGNMNELCS